MSRISGIEATWSPHQEGQCGWPVSTTWKSFPEARNPRIVEWDLLVFVILLRGLYKIALSLRVCRLVAELPADTKIQACPRSFCKQ
jgi:hypothetical protein